MHWGGGCHGGIPADGTLKGPACQVSGAFLGFKSVIETSIFSRMPQKQVLTPRAAEAPAKTAWGIRALIAFMKTTRSIIILLSSIAMLSAEDLGGSSGKLYKSDAPNGRFSVRANQEKGYYKFNVEILDLTSHAPVLEFDPKARFIGAAWSPDSKLVAIEQNKSTHDSAVSVFSVVPNAAKGLALPKECDDEKTAALESPTRKHARKADSLKFHFTPEGLQIVKWLSPGELVLSASGMGWWGGDSAEDRDTRFLAEYEITIDFAADGTSSMQKLELKKYDEL
jgi:hypothetical protein